MPDVDDRPPPPEWLDKELVASVLRKALGDQELVVEHLDVGYACSRGTQFLSEMFRVRAIVNRITGKTEQRSLVVKCLLRSGPLLKTIQEAQLFLKETLIYTVLLHTTGAVLEATEGSKWRPLAARCHHTGSQPTDFLVLEDLAETGFTMPPRGQLLDRQHCALVLKAVARLHATSLLVADHEPFAAACFSQHPLFSKSGREYFSDMINKMYSALADHLEMHAGYEKFALKYRETKADAVDRLEFTMSKCSPRLKVMAHGDLWRNNIMFRYDGGCPVDVRLVDFQNCFWSSPAADIQHLLGTSASLDVHQHHVDSLVSEYHGELQATLRALGFQQQADAFPLHQLRREMDQLAPHALCMASIMVPMLLAPESQGKEAEEAVNHTLTGDKFFKQIVANPEFISYIKHILPLYEKNGAV